MKTAMQDLREDLVKTKTTGFDALTEIENLEIRKAVQKTLTITIDTILNRIDEELLPLEREQIIEAVDFAIDDRQMYESFQTLKDGNHYFELTFNNQ